MNNLAEEVVILDIRNLFDNIKYVIPIYQRNYAWGKSQIEQLIIDIIDSEIQERGEYYYLGNLIVRDISKDEFEVVDGQQRLTTLFLLISYLNSNVSDSNKIPLNKNALSFEARKRSDDTLQVLGDFNLSQNNNSEFYSEEILEGYRCIEKFFSGANKKNKIETVTKNLAEKIKLLRVKVPKDVDMNHYFEIMNTRGEQLEQHEIAKSKFLEKLPDEDIKTASLIWDACSDMSSYVQMNFKKIYREEIFGKNWDTFTNKNFDEISEKIRQIDEGNSCVINKAKITLCDIIQLKRKNDPENEEDIEDEKKRFESIISFLDFVLQVNEVLGTENNNSLDDKFFLKLIQAHYSNTASAKEFLFNLLKFRYWFDKYIVKREYIKDYNQEGKWSLQKLKADSISKNAKPRYNATYTLSDFNDDEDGSDLNKKIRMLQSCLRITYTSPKVMHWISNTLKFINRNGEEADLLLCLQDYCRQKIRESNFEDKKGFDIERIVFTYLDYLLYWNHKTLKEKIEGFNFDLNKSWQFQFRNSIEHFYPQHPDNEYWKKDEKQECLNSFGNLALITVSGNSKFSNIDPVAKRRKESIIEQSIKLKIMSNMMTDSEWKVEMVKKHNDNMICVLKEDLKLQNQN